MALKSETLQTPPFVLGSASKNVSDEKPSNEEDLEDGEIFDDEDDDGNDKEAAAVASLNVRKQQQSDFTDTSSCTNTVPGSSNISVSKNITKESAVPDSTVSLKTVSDAASSSCSNLKSEQQPQGGFIPPWKNSNADVTSASDNTSAKQLNSFISEDKRSSRENKKKKRKRFKDGDDNEKHVKEKRARKSSDRDTQPNSNNYIDHQGDNLQPPDDDEDIGEDDDDDEMLFIRGASPTLHHNKRRRRSGSHDDDNEYLDDDNDDFADDDFDDEGDNENEERRRLRLNDVPGSVDRAARRERLSSRGKRRGRGGTGNREGNSKRRKDDSEICIFYLQGKCQKGGECPFSHDAMPHKKMELCKFYLMDCCNKKDKCLYMHSEFPCKYYHMGLKCYANKNCKFSHAKLSDAMRQIFIKTFGPISNRANKEFSNKKGSSNKHRQQDGPGDFSRGGRDCRRGSDGNKRNVGSAGGGGVGPEKKIPSLFDIKVSIPTEMRNNANNNNQSDSDGNHTPMPSPPHVQQMLLMSDSSRSPPPLAMSPTVPSVRKRKKDRKGDRGKKSSDRRRGDRNESSNKRLPLMLMNNDSNWDEMMLEHQRLQQQFLAENCHNFVNDGDRNDNVGGDNGDDDDDEGQLHISSSQVFSGQHDVYSNNSSQSNSNNSNSNNSKSNNCAVDVGSVADTTISSQRPPSPPNDTDTDTGGGLQLATQSNDSSNEMFPAHLPKKQRELFLRIKQQQRQAEDSGSNGGGRLQIAEDVDEESNENNMSTSGDRNNSSAPSNMDDKDKSNDSYNIKLKQHDENWYSSDEEDEQQSSSGSSSLTAILQNLVRLNSNNNNPDNNSTLSSPTFTDSQPSNVNSIFSSIQSSSSVVTSSFSSAVIGSCISSSSSSGSGGVVSNINPSGITSVDFDINEVSALLSKVKQHFQTNEKKVRDPRLSRSDVGPSGDSPSGGTSTSNSTVPTSNLSASLSLSQSHNPSVTGTEDVDLRLNTSNNKGVGAGDMDLRNLPFKPAPVHSAATEIDASINSHSPLPYRLIPFVVAKPDYSSIQTNSKVGTADPRLRKTLRVSEESSSVVSSRDPRHRLIDNVSKEKTNAQSVQNSDPRQRARSATTGVPTMISTTMTEEQLLPPSLMLSHLRASFPMMHNPGSDTGMLCPSTPRTDDEPLSNFMAPPIMTRPTDPRQRHSQANLPPPVAQLPPSLFDVMNAMQNIRQPSFTSQTGDPRTRPPGVPNMPNLPIFPGTVRSNDPINRGQYGFK